MNLTEYAGIAWESLRANKLRSALTLLGIVIGVFAIVSSVTAVRVIDVYFDDTIKFLGSTAFSIQREPAVRLGHLDERIRRRKMITLEQIELYERRASLPLSVSPTYWMARKKITYLDRETRHNVQFSGSDEAWVVNNSYDVESGRFLTEADVQFARPFLVIGKSVADLLFTDRSPLGKEVRIDGHRFIVIGVLASKGSAFGTDLDLIAIAPVTRLLDLYGAHNRSLSVEIRAPSVQLLQATMDEAAGLLRTIRKVPPGEDNDFEIVTNESLLSAFTSFTKYLTIGGAGIGLIALLAAGIGIMNIMLVSVTERTREIGTRKAVGATRGAVLRQFLLEAIFLCQIGGILGILLGILGGNIMALAFGIRPTFPWDWVALGVGGITIVALIFGVYPAYKAARLNPIDALRYE
jgi:putative ABC transport system permease protein